MEDGYCTFLAVVRLVSKLESAGDVIEVLPFLFGPPELTHVQVQWERLKVRGEGDDRG